MNMEGLIQLFMCYVMIHMLLQIPIGAAQVLHALFRICTPGQPQAYYHRLKQYLICVVLFFATWMVGYNVMIHWTETGAMMAITLLYLMVLPTAMAIHYCKISKRTDYEEIEKLIF